MKSLFTFQTEEDYNKASNVGNINIVRVKVFHDDGYKDFPVYSQEQLNKVVKDLDSKLKRYEIYRHISIK